MSTSKRKARSYHHGDLRASIQHAAGEILEKEGLDAVTLREVARRAGVSHSAPSRHFPEREALLAALAGEGFAMLGEAQRRAAATGGARGLGEAYVRFALAHPQRFRLMFGGRIAVTSHPVLKEAALKSFNAVADVMAASVPGPAARDAAVAAWSLVHGLAMLLLDHRIATAARAGRGDEEFVHQVLGMIRFAGGVARPPAGAPAQSSE
jgi:AcrR family transcriptional regulator